MGDISNTLDTEKLEGYAAAEALDDIASEGAINYEELDKVLSTIDFKSITNQESINKLDDAVTEILNKILKRIEKEPHYAFSENFPKLDKLLLKLTETGLNYKQLSDIYTLHKKATGVLEIGGDVQRAYNKDKGSPVMAKLDTALQDVDNKFRLALRVKVKSPTERGVEDQRDMQRDVQRKAKIEADKRDKIDEQMYNAKEAAKESAREAKRAEYKEMGLSEDDISKQQWAEAIARQKAQMEKQRIAEAKRENIVHTKRKTIGFLEKLLVLLGCNKRLQDAFVKHFGEGVSGLIKQEIDTSRLQITELEKDLPRNNLANPFRRNSDSRTAPRVKKEIDHPQGTPVIQDGSRI